jgi:hypothetical protein
MTISTIRTINNPVTGIFGSGNQQWFSASKLWKVPTGINAVRVRLWGAGGNAGYSSPYYYAGGGGGFAMKTIYDLGGLQNIFINVAATSGATSSFGNFVSATGGTNGSASATIAAGDGELNSSGGSGVGGDINYSGGKGSSATTGGEYGPGGSASLFGNGGNGANYSDIYLNINSTGGAGGGACNLVTLPVKGGSGFMSTGSYYSYSTGIFIPPTPGAYLNNPSIDYIGCGGGGGLLINAGRSSGRISGINGGGNGGWPGGGSGDTSYSINGATGLVIVEW